jgi:hypothetical protein
MSRVPSLVARSLQSIVNFPFAVAVLGSHSGCPAFESRLIDSLLPLTCVRGRRSLLPLVCACGRPARSAQRACVARSLIFSDKIPQWLTAPRTFHISLHLGSARAQSLALRPVGLIRCPAIRRHCPSETLRLRNRRGTDGAERGRTKPALQR